MKQHSLVRRVVTAATLAGVMAMTPSSNAQVGLQRRLLLQQDLAIPGYEIVHAEASIAVGGREGKHWHPGTLIGHLLEGEMVLELEGKPTRRIKAGESVLIEPRQVHEGINTGSVPIKALTTFIVEKGKPLTTPTP